MKTKFLMLSLSVAAVSFTSCKSDEEKQAEMTVDRYEKYVDSLANVSADEAKANWESIEAEYAARTTDAEAAVASFKNPEAAEKRVTESKTQYEEMKAKYAAEMEAAATPEGPKVYVTLFPGGAVGKDLNFDWVNKDNILKVYNDFNNAYDANKDSFSREDFDEIKKAWEALDARKNTVEKEGLSSGDNLKIANLKMKWSPTFKIDRMKAKGDENQDAKDAAE